ncbi:MAG: hypothetical protein IRZ08_11290 [Frankia sp.]|nr:hypothetical protein [Frankia sp.]
MTNLPASAAAKASSSGQLQGARPRARRNGPGMAESPEGRRQAQDKEQDKEKV